MNVLLDLNILNNTKVMSTLLTYINDKNANILIPTMLIEEALDNGTSSATNLKQRLFELSIFGNKLKVVIEVGEMFRRELNPANSSMEINYISEIDTSWINLHLKEFLKDKDYEFMNGLKDYITNISHEFSLKEDHIKNKDNLVIAVNSIKKSLYPKTLKKFKSTYSTLETVQLYGTTKYREYVHTTMATKVENGHSLQANSAYMIYSDLKLIRALLWIKNNGVEGVKPKVVKNDNLDLDYIVSAIKTNSILVTNDKKLRTLYFDYLHTFHPLNESDHTELSCVYSLITPYLP